LFEVFPPPPPPPPPGRNKSSNAQDMPGGRVEGEVNVSLWFVHYNTVKPYSVATLGELNGLWLLNRGKNNRKVIIETLIVGQLLEVAV